MAYIFAVYSGGQMRSSMEQMEICRYKTTSTIVSKIHAAGITSCRSKDMIHGVTGMSDYETKVGHTVIEIISGTSCI